MPDAIRVTEVFDHVTYEDLLERPLLLLGQPGIGKTSVVAQFARAEAERQGRRFLDVRAASRDELAEAMRRPRDFFLFYRLPAPHVWPDELGMPQPRRVDGLAYASIAPLEYLAVFSARGAAGVLFIDEVTSVQHPEQQSMWFTVLQERVASWSIRFSDGVAFVLAGNSPGESSVAAELPAPLVNRMRVVEVGPPTVDEWMHYMVARHGSEWGAPVYPFLRDNAHLFAPGPRAVATLENFPSPRSWEAVARLYWRFERRRPGFWRDERALAVFAKLVEGDVGKAAAEQFLATISSGVPGLDEFLSDPARWWARLDEHGKRLVAATVAANLESPRVYRALGRLVPVLESDREAFMVFYSVLKAAYAAMMERAEEAAERGDREYYRRYLEATEELNRLGDLWERTESEIEERVRRLARLLGGGPGA